ncbi:hypothetical protein TNCV_2257901 [Trichonephila clavipes]|nr:hypothetical protein TNCV_2257901 [Trichonephila clavipes]
MMRFSQALKEYLLKYEQKQVKGILQYAFDRRGQKLLENTQMGCPTPLTVFFRHCSFRLLPVLINDSWPVTAALPLLSGM